MVTGRRCCRQAAGLADGRAADFVALATGARREERELMPDYVYRCQECGRRSRHFYTYADYERAQPVCPHCQSRQLRRVIGRVAVARTEDSRLDALADDDMMAGLDSEDPRALGRFMRQMSSEMGEDLGDEFHEVVDRLERGESPESIEESMPDLGEDAGSAFGGDDLDF